jgi:hypothetical protein
MEPGWYCKNAIFGTKKKLERGFGTVLFQKLSVPKVPSRVGGHPPPEAEAQFIPKLVYSKKKVGLPADLFQILCVPKNPNCTVFLCCQRHNLNRNQPESKTAAPNDG